MSVSFDYRSKKQKLSSLRLEQWFLTWGKFTPRGKFHLPRG